MPSSVTLLPSKLSEWSCGKTGVVTGTEGRVQDKCGLCCMTASSEYQLLPATASSIAIQHIAKVCLQGPRDQINVHLEEHNQDHCWLLVDSWHCQYGKLVSCVTSAHSQHFICWWRAAWLRLPSSAADD